MDEMEIDVVGSTQILGHSNVRIAPDRASVSSMEGECRRAVNVDFLDVGQCAGHEKPEVLLVVFASEVFQNIGRKTTVVIHGIVLLICCIVASSKTMSTTVL